MKKIKLLLISLIILTCSGCTIEYNINITKDYVEEVANVNDQISQSRTEKMILDNYDMWYPTYAADLGDLSSPEAVIFKEKLEGAEYHEKSINQSGDVYNYTYKYTYPIEKYNDANVLNNTFEEVTFFEGDDYLTIRTSKRNLLCSEEIFESATINITVDTDVYKLNSTNATNINNNTFTWILDKNNCNDSQIILTLDEKKTTIETKPEETNPDNVENHNKENNNNYVLYIFLGILILLILIGYTLFNKMKERNNQMDD